MRTFLTAILIFSFMLSLNGLAYSEDLEQEKKSSGGGEALTGAVMGGLLGGGLGAAIGSASGHAGTGALIGAGVGAVGGTLVGANEADRKRQAAEESSYTAPLKTATPKDSKIKKRIIREYDEQGNVISEKEVTN